MATPQISEQVRQLILKGKLDDAAETLIRYYDKELVSRGNKVEEQLYNQVLYQLSQLNELKHQVFAGIISNEEADLKRNKIRVVLLEVSNALQNSDSSRPISPVVTPMEMVEEFQRRQRSIFSIITWGIPLIILAVSLFLGYKMCYGGLDTVQPTIKQSASKQQPIAPSTDISTRNSNTEVSEMTGCYVRTRMMTGLLMQPEVMGQPFMELPDNTEYQVLEVKKKTWARQPVYFFKIKHDEYEGWVRQVELEFVSPACLR